MEVVITLIDKRTRNVSLSMKAKDSVEEKAAMKDYNDQSTQSLLVQHWVIYLKKQKINNF